MGFHVGVALLMNIKFPYPLAFVPYLAFFRLERWHESKLGGALRPISMGRPGRALLSMSMETRTPTNIPKTTRAACSRG